MRTHYQTTASTYGLGHDLAADWRDLAACVEVDPEIFFPLTGDSATGQRARRVCAGCEVREQCRDYAIAEKITDGIWGGMTYEDRRAHARQVPA